MPPCVGVSVRKTLDADVSPIASFCLQGPVTRVFLRVAVVAVAGREEEEDSRSSLMENECQRTSRRLPSLKVGHVRRHRHCRMVPWGALRRGTSYSRTSGFAPWRYPDVRSFVPLGTGVPAREVLFVFCQF